MNEEEKQAIERIKKLYLNSLDLNKTTVVLTEDTRCLGIVLNLIEKQEKIIDLMAEHIYIGNDFDNRIRTIADIKQYFEDEIKESE